MTLPARPIRVAILRDYLEEGWTSMDLVASMIATHLNRRPGGEIEALEILPPFRPRLGGSKSGRDADRMIHRHVDYAILARRLARSGRFDLFHVVDHSYAHLAHALPGGRTVVTCHDLDAFRCLFEPEVEPRPLWFRLLAGRTLAGLRKAAVVVADGEATRRGLIARGIVPEGRTRVIPLGAHPECSPEADPVADLEAVRLLGPGGGVELLHVGSNIPRKRVDVLLEVFAGVRRRFPGARLIKVGGALPPSLAATAERLGVAEGVVATPHVSASTLAAIYRRASLVLQPSEAEGFGLPVLEALACGAPVLASDIPALREVAGDLAEFRPVGDVDGWVARAIEILEGGSEIRSARRGAGLARAGRFGWPAHVEALAGVYRAVLDGGDLGKV